MAVTQKLYCIQGNKMHFSEVHPAAYQKSDKRVIRNVTEAVPFPLTLQNTSPLP